MTDYKNMGTQKTSCAHVHKIIKVTQTEISHINK